MAILTPTRLIAGALSAGLAIGLSGCQSAMTYGTGKAPGMQTVEDLVGIAALSTATKEPIDYKPRPKIVAPPTTATLPPPSDGNTTALASNWPVDPDAQAAKIRADAAAREATGAPTPFFRVPKGPDDGQPVVYDRDPEKEALGTAEQSAAARKLFADARGAIAVDENGNPVRRYLTDPPSEYRIPDPTAPVEIIDKPKKKRKFLWWSWDR